ncbi:STAS domain-containing protein [Kitasatospora sp. NBC_00315]|uniref:STAS domain-containing protein n=1 Tax=Kitasatospora sp. NBC_00315 TaxID=2975963 RepID=UPI003255D9BB
MPATRQVDPPSFSVRLRPGAGAPVLAVVGELEQRTGSVLDAAVADVMDAVIAAGELVLDLSGVRFCDSGGLNAVIRAHLRSRDAGAVLHVLSPAARVAALFRRTGVDQVLRVSPDAGTPVAEGPAHRRG